jgi:hypothetical protein
MAVCCDLRAPQRCFNIIVWYTSSKLQKAFSSAANWTAFAGVSGGTTLYWAVNPSDEDIYNILMYAAASARKDLTTGLQLPAGELANELGAMLDLSGLYSVARGKVCDICR